MNKEWRKKLQKRTKNEIKKEKFEKYEKTLSLSP